MRTMMRWTLAAVAVIVTTACGQMNQAGPTPILSEQTSSPVAGTGTGTGRITAFNVANSQPTLRLDGRSTQHGFTDGQGALRFDFQAYKSSHDMANFVIEWYKIEQSGEIRQPDINVSRTAPGEYEINPIQSGRYKARIRAFEAGRESPWSEFAYVSFGTDTVSQDVPRGPVCPSGRPAPAGYVWNEGYLWNDSTSGCFEPEPDDDLDEHGFPRYCAGDGRDNDRDGTVDEPGEKQRLNPGDDHRCRVR